VRGAVPSFAIVTPAEAHLLIATLAERAGEAEQAAVSVRTALELAEPRGAVRVFRDAGPDVRQLLVDRAGRLGRLDSFLAVVLDALPADGRDTTELTPREVRLLRELPSLSTVEEIATTLFVSVNTVKTHLRHMYRKLGVRSRREAVAVARRRGLL
jgi:LuxR family maltose regulon positive regulatory protein